MTGAPARVHPREATLSARPDAWLDRILSRMPRTADARVDSYLETLERALLDGVLAEHEKDALVEVAYALGLTRGAVLDLHGRYLDAMAEVALEDGVVTEQERSDLDRIATALGLREGDVVRALEAATSIRSLDAAGGSGHGNAPGGHGAALRLGTAGIDLAPGDRIVFTGAMVRDRASWEALARELDYVPGSVTKKTALVVAADPNSQSGKAAKARAYGIPIITEEAFARMVGA
ncbi:hypothetical protein CFK39_10640 [Brachybacterium avium]|uniref:BRCT domain-containing protein n=1 Tax=Brachybacterium avium TaxID=2017485 RepID=A0A220UDL8_9MICO|nr:BRCT domain-containing protein [Brachybacterium avium]ASK66195.1 hypothetical protein CFK39_10640 [Brachybacterium avium]